ncbi:MAG: lipopolysaccharide kinase InaA family protein [Planctomycetota bacterium]
MLTIKDSLPDLVIPPYFRIRESADEWRLCHQDYKADIDSIFDDRYTASRTSEGRDRYALVRIKSASGAEGEAIVRTYKRGGLSGLVLPDIFTDARRPLEELVITEQGRAKGVALPEVLGLQIKWLMPLFYRAKIIIKIIPQAVTLDDFIRALSKEGNSQKLYQQKTALINSIASALKTFHNAGICHRDLNVRNILIQSKPGLPAEASAQAGDAALKTYIIDLDKSICRPDSAGLSLDERVNNLIRLNRSLDKLLFKTGLPLKGAINRTDRLRLFETYFQNDGLTKAQKRIFIIRCLKEAGLHKWWWKLIYPAHK